MDGETLCLNNGLKPINTSSVPEGEIVETFDWRFDKYYTEIQLFCVFPSLPSGSAAHRLVVGASGCSLYVPGAVPNDGNERYVWIRVDNRDNALPLSGIIAGKEAYHSAGSLIGMYIKPGSRSKFMYFNKLAGGYPSGTTIKVFAR